MMRNLSSVDSYMLLFLLVYEIIIFVMISGIGGSEEKDKLSYTSLSSLDSYMLYLLAYEIIILVMISVTCSKM